MDLGAIIEALLRQEDLSSAEAESTMGALMEGTVADVQVAAFLVALRAKGTTSAELAAFASAMRSRAVSLPSAPAGLVDTCGTGGGIPSFNISTASAIVASAAGLKVAKHGNRAMSSKCGSADVLEALGVTLVSDPECLSRLLDEIGLAFLFAPMHHPAMKHVGPVRKALGIRTVFNQLGPLANPAGADHQVIGIFDPKMGVPMSEAASSLAKGTVWVVWGTDGLDEVSPCGPTKVWKNGQLQEVVPEDFGIAPVDQAVLSPGESPSENAAILLDAITDVNSLRAEAVIPSAAAALAVGGCGSMLECGSAARDAIASGRARAKLDALIEATRP